MFQKSKIKNEIKIHEKNPQKWTIIKVSFDNKVHNIKRQKLGN